MKTEINLKKLKEILLSISHIANRHMTLPVLSCILIDVKGNTATFKATNLEVGIEMTVSVKTTKDGIVAVPASIISSFVSQIIDDNQVVKLEEINGNLQITTAKSKGVIKTQSFEDFPSIPKVPTDKSFSIATEAFLKGLKAVWYSSSVSSVKPELSSVYVYKDEGNLVFVATDSFRLAEKRIRNQDVNTGAEFLLPFKNIPDIVRILESVKGSVKVIFNKNLISFLSNEIYLVSRLIDGVFPDYRQIIPQKYNTEVVVLKQDLINALKVSNVFSDKFNQIHLTIDPKNKIFKVQTKNSDVGENSTMIDAAINGEPIEINFNYKYIADCFQAIESDSLTLQLNGNTKPMIIKPISGEQNFTYLAMPMNR